MFSTLVNQAKILDQLGGIWIIYLLVFVRCLAFCSMAPLIGHKSVPALVKVSFAIILSLMIFPLLHAPHEHPTGLNFVVLIIMNVFVGMFLGWVTNLVIEIGKTAGEMLDMQLGLQSATMFDPGSQTQVTIMGRFFDVVALTLFISLGGMEKIIQGFYKSYEVFPIILYHFDLNFAHIIKAGGQVSAMAFLIASPIVIIILITDLILGIMSRAAPQVNAFQISFSIKPTIGLILVLMLLSSFLQVLSSLLSNPFRFM